MSRKVPGNDGSIEKVRAARLAKVATTRDPQLIAERAAGATWADLARKYDISSERVKQIVAKAERLARRATI